MFDWLFEGHRHLEVYLFLAAVTVVAFVKAAVGTRRRRWRRWLAETAVAAAFAGLYFVLDMAVETDSEQIERKVDAMAAGVKKAAQLDAVFDNVSDQFSNPKTPNKAALQELVKGDLDTFSITEVRISDFHSGEISRERNTAVADFRAKIILSNARGPDAVSVHCDATFDYDASHGWRMRTLKVKGEYPFADQEWP